MTRAWLLGVIALALSSTGATCNCAAGPPIPEPDVCRDPPASFSVDSIEIGSEADPFAPFADGAIATLEYGPQGGAMIPIRLRARGADVPGCMPHATTVHRIDGGVAGEEIANETEPLRTYDQGDGSRATDVLFVILHYPEPVAGDAVLVRLSVGALTVERALWLRHRTDAGSPTMP